MSSFDNLRSISFFPGLDSHKESDNRQFKEYVKRVSIEYFIHISILAVISWFVSRRETEL